MPTGKLENLTEFNLSEWVLRQLGYPTRNVELTEEQLNDSIMFALQEVQPWYTITEYLTLDLNNKTAIDLSEYNIYEVLDVIKIPNNLNANSSAADDIFNNPRYGVGGYGIVAGGHISTYPYISRLTNSSIHHVISGYAKQYREMFYSRLATILAQRTAGTVLPGMNYEYDRTSKTLYIASGYPSSTVITIEYIPYIDEFYKIKDERYRRCAQDLALGHAMQILYRVVGKYDVGNAPAKVNYSMYMNDSEKLITQAKEELKRISQTTFTID